MLNGTPHVLGTTVRARMCAAVRPGERTTGRVANDDGTDIALSVVTPKQSNHRSGERVSKITSYTKVEGAWHSTFNQTTC